MTNTYPACRISITDSITDDMELQIIADTTTETNTSWYVNNDDNPQNKGAQIYS